MKYTPLSFSQERILLIDSFLVDNFNVRIYNVPVIIELSGKLEVSKLNHAVNFTINKHSALRSTIKLTDSGDKYQQIIDKLKYKLVIEDISPIKGKKKQETKEEIISKLVNHKFQLSSSNPLFIVSLVRLDKNKYTLVFVFHHIIMDEWSIGIFLNELEQVYNCLVEGKELINNVMQSQFDQYCKLQKEKFESNYFAKKIEYWNKKFSMVPDYESSLGFPMVLKISDSGFYQSVVSNILTTKIEKFCRENSVTLFMFLIALYFLLLSKLTKESDIYVVTPIANRMEAISEQMIGCFVNTVLLYCKVGDEMKFSDLLESVKSDCMDAFDNQDAPILLAQSINDERCNVNQLQNFAFELKAKAKYAIHLKNLESSYYSSSDFSDQSGSQKEPSNNDILLELEYQIDTHGHQFAKEFIDNFSKLIEVVLSDTSITIRDMQNNTNSKTSNTYSNICQDNAANKMVKDNFGCKPSTSLENSIIQRLNNMLKLSVKY